MSIKDKIESLPDNKIWLATNGDRTVIADLKALAASHTALLDAAKKFLRLTLTEKPCFPDQLESAIEEAEKL